MAEETNILTGDDAAMAIRQGYPHPIAYTYTAAYHCPACTARAFGVDADTGFIPETAHDSEGNPIGAVAPWDEWEEVSEIRAQYLTCDDCGGTIASYIPTDAIVADAETEGYAAGKAAGSWIIDGNTSEETARAILAGIEDGDPATYDQLPSSPLSGEWADAPTPLTIHGWYGITPEDDCADDVLSAYEDGYARGVEDEVVRSARAILPALQCPECGEPVWDGPKGSKLAKCWNATGHASREPLAFDTMGDDAEYGADAPTSPQDAASDPASFEVYDAVQHRYVRRHWRDDGRGLETC